MTSRRRNLLKNRGAGWAYWNEPIGSVTFSYVTDFPNDLFEALTEYFKTGKVQRVGFTTEGSEYNLIFYNNHVYFESVSKYGNQPKSKVCEDIFKFANKVISEIEEDIEGWVKFKMPSDYSEHEKRIRDNISKLKSAIKASKIKEKHYDSEKQYLKDLIESGAKEIHLDCDYVLNDESFDFIPIEIGDGTVIDGHGHSIYGCDSNIFKIIGDDVVLKNITFKNSAIAVIVDSPNGRVDISECKFIGNYLITGGCALSNNRGVVNVSECYFADNHSLTMGTAIINSDNLTLIDCTFENNEPENVAVTHNIIIRNCETGNLTIENTIFNEVNDKPLILNNGHINFKKKTLENIITEEQAFRYEYTPQPKKWPYPPSENAKSFEYLKNLTKTDNEIKLDFDIENSDSSDTIILDIEGMTIDGQGHIINACRQSGIFEIKADNICLKNINFENGIPAILNRESENLNIINCSFQKNERAITNVCEATIKDCRFKYNRAQDGDGGAIIGRNKLINCEFEENSAREGGALYNASQILNCKFINNKAKRGGAIKNYSGMEIENCQFIGNTATIAGAILYDGETVKIKNSSFKNNESKTHGGAITTTEYSFGEIANCEFDSNKSHFGGAIMNKSNAKVFDMLPLDTELLTIHDCTFKNNKGKYDNAICNDGILEISKTAFEDEKPIINRGPEAELTLKECNIDEIYAKTFNLKQ